ncbi:hypothetical protein V3C99_001124, partial [Haemonchus contortus]
MWRKTRTPPPPPPSATASQPASRLAAVAVLECCADDDGSSAQFMASADIATNGDAKCFRRPMPMTADFCQQSFHRTDIFRTEAPGRSFV